MGRYVTKDSMEAALGPLRSGAWLGARQSNPKRSAFDLGIVLGCLAAARMGNPQVVGFASSAKGERNETASRVKT